MGIPVDARGNRIPIQGYPPLGFGLASAVVFTILAFGIAMLGMPRRRRLN